MVTCASTVSGRMGRIMVVLEAVEDIIENGLWLSVCVTAHLEINLDLD